MKKLFVKLSFLISLICLTSQSWALPPCPIDTNTIRGSCFGTNTFANGNKYVGEYKGYKRHGQGTFIWADINIGNKYVGEYQNNQMHGQGIYTYSNGDKFVGEYKNDKINGQGTYTHKNGNKYRGEF